MIVQDLEASVIGGLLIGGLTPDADDVLNMLGAEAFSIPAYRVIYREIQKQARTRSLIDAMLVAEGVGDEFFVAVMDAYKTCPSAANLPGYARQVSENHERNVVLSIMDDERNRIAAGNTFVASQAIDSMLSRIAAARTPRDEIVPVHSGELLDTYAEHLEQRVRNGEASDMLRTGLHGVDHVTGGINPDDLVVVAARPGMGKTELALCIAQGVAQQTTPEGLRRGVLVFSMEMSAQQIIERQIADAGNLPVSALRNPSRMDDEEWGRVSMGIRALTGVDTWIVDASNLTAEQIRATAVRHKQRYPGLSLIVIDYLTLIDLPKAERHDLAVGKVTKTLKQTAKKLHVPVVLLSQLSRDVEKRPNKRPVSADLRDSGSIEQDADVIVMLYREAVYNEQSAAAPFAELIFTKCRHGKPGTVYKRFVNGHFKPCDQDEAREACTRQAAKPPRRYANSSAGTDV